MAPFHSVAVFVGFAAKAAAFGAVASDRNRGKGFLAGGMQPDVAARTLASVQDEWEAQAQLFEECSSTSLAATDPLVDCDGAPKAFARSCNKVVQAMVQASGGDRDSVKEYLGDVCGQSVLTGWRTGRCDSLADGITNLMTQDSFDNREGLKTDSLCRKMWSEFLEENKQTAIREQARRQEEHKAVEASGVQKKNVTATEGKKTDEEDARREKAKAEAQAKAASFAKDTSEGETKAKAEAHKKAAAAVKEKAEETKAQVEAKAKAASAAKERARDQAKTSTQAASAKSEEKVKAAKAKTDEHSKVGAQPVANITAASKEQGKTNVTKAGKQSMHTKAVAQSRQAIVNASIRKAEAPKKA